MLDVEAEGVGREREAVLQQEHALEMREGRSLQPTATWLGLRQASMLCRRRRRGIRSVLRRRGNSCPGLCVSG